MKCTAFAASALAALVLVPSNSFASVPESDLRWVSEWGMGINESKVTAGNGNQISVTCPDFPSQNQVMNYNLIEFQIAGSPPPDRKITATFDNQVTEEYNLNNPSGMKAGQDESMFEIREFHHLLDMFRSHSVVNIQFSNGKNATFTLKGSKKSIGNCNQS